jgi:methionyl-tRNA formyltransferase
VKIIFFGTPDFALTTLQGLYEHGCEILAVVTAPDALGGRGGKVLLQSPVKKYALEAGIPVLQPTNLKSEVFQQELRTLNADIFIVVAFRMLPEVVWNMPVHGSYNLHASLLPRYRGAAPINWAIINGETVTGVTMFKLSHAIDTGDILLQEKCTIEPEDNFGTLYEKLKHLGCQTVLRGLDMLESSATTKLWQQADQEATHAPKIYHDTCEINFNQPAKQIVDFVRGLSPYPGAWTKINGVECKILDAAISSEETSTSQPPGNIKNVGNKKLLISTENGYISVERLKMSGSKEMVIRDFLSGYRNIPEKTG